MKWTFPDQNGLGEGEYYREVASENISFQAKIKYLPKGRQRQSDQLVQHVRRLRDRIQVESLAFDKLCQYEPFLDHLEEKKDEGKDDEPFSCKQCWIGCFPILLQYVKVTYWFTIILILF